MYTHTHTHTHTYKLNKMLRTRDTVGKKNIAFPGTSLEVQWSSG